MLVIVHVFIAGQATVDGLSQQIRQGQPRVLSPLTIRQVFADEFAHPKRSCNSRTKSSATVRKSLVISWQPTLNLD